MLKRGVTAIPRDDRPDAIALFIVIRVGLDDEPK
jgi:hypothetical protein